MNDELEKERAAHAQTFHQLTARMQDICALKRYKIVTEHGMSFLREDPVGPYLKYDDVTLTLNGMSK